MPFTYFLSRSAGTNVFNDTFQLSARSPLEDKRKEELALAQYAFEEICAKTLYNLTQEPAPFDPNSPFWVLPLAVDFGLRFGVTDLGEISPLLRAR